VLVGCIIDKIRSVALFDFDKTLYNGFSYFDLLAKQTEEGVVSKDVFMAAQNILQEYQNGTAGYETSVAQLLSLQAAGLRGRDYQAVYDSSFAFFAESAKMYPFATEIFDVLRPTHDIYLVTAEPQFIAESVVAANGLYGYFATQYEVDEGKFTGTVATSLASNHENCVL